MAHVSQHKIEEDLFVKLFKELQILISKTDVSSADAALTALLTETEKIMLTKRFSAILLMSQGASSYEIWHVLKLSSSTVAKLRQEYDGGVYEALVKVFQKSLAKDFIKAFEILLQAGLPPRSKNRWQSVPGFGKLR